MADDQNEEEHWDVKYRIDEENEFFTELAFHETERWIEAVTRKKLEYPDDLRKSLENGQLLCILLNSLKPGSVKRINKLPGPIAGLDNVNVFLNACRKEFHLNDTHLFDPCDLEDLSQRAIAETKYLKQEVERRLKNVAVTVFWLGRTVASHNNGPQLDPSAFSGLINYHGKEVFEEETFHSNSWNSEEHSSSEGNSKVVTKDGEHRHTRDSSYESFASYDRVSESSIDEPILDNMPVRSDMRRYGSASSLNRSSDLSARFSGTFDSVYSEDKDSSLYRSSPDISVGSHAHTRSSSTDSMDGSYHGNHSRQSSGSVENYPTRTTQRKVSQASADPLKFVKAQSAAELARQAQVQIEAAAETKSMRVLPGKDDIDWQSKLGDWKNKRRRHSEAMEHRVGSLDLPKETEVSKHKTYGQIVQERKVRKGLSISSFYPNEEEDDPFFNKKEKEKEKRSRVSTDESWIKTTAAKKVEATHNLLIKKLPSFEETSPSKTRERKDSYKTYDDTTVASWAQDSDEDGSSSSKADDKNSTDTLGDSGIECSKTDSKDDLVSEDRNEINKKDAFSKKFTDESKNKSGENKIIKSEPVASSNKINNIRKAFEEKEKTAHKPNHSRGFGFSIAGGADKRQPITVEKVNLGGAADVCELQLSDEIISINKRDISHLTSIQVKRIIEEGVRVGHIELKVKRCISSKEDEFFDPESKYGGDEEGNKSAEQVWQTHKHALCAEVYITGLKRCPDNPRPEAVKMTECQENDNTTQHEAVTESCNITLFTKESPSTNEILVMESLGAAVIDTACTKTVCGENWLRSYEEALNSDQKQKVNKSQSDKRFRLVMEM
ncbi:hypothetical protein ScPMuIL_011539 [Solemya velum]